MPISVWPSKRGWKFLGGLAGQIARRFRVNSLRTRGMRISRLAVESSAIAAAATIIGIATRMRGTPAAINAVISLCR